jgi:HD superfamily phosphodiesterase
MTNLINIPSDLEIEKLHRKLAPSQVVFDLVYSHSMAVHAIAKQLIDTRHIGVDRNFVLAACLLHDIGAYALY